MGVSTSQCADVDNLVGAEREFGANIGGGESHTKFHFTPFQEDKDGMFVWARLSLLEFSWNATQYVLIQEPERRAWDCCL